jgi:hypothetical protein
MIINAKKAGNGLMLHFSHLVKANKYGFRTVING